MILNHAHGLHKRISALSPLGLGSSKRGQAAAAASSTDLTCSHDDGAPPPVLILTPDECIPPPPPPGPPPQDVGRMAADEVTDSHEGGESTRSILQQGEEAVALGGIAASAGANFSSLWSSINVCAEHAAQSRRGVKALANLLIQFGSIEDQASQNLAQLRTKKDLSLEVGDLRAATPVLQGKQGCRERCKSESSSVNNSDGVTLGESLSTFGLVFLDNIIKSKVIVAHEYSSLGNSLYAFCKEQGALFKQLQSESDRLDRQLETQQYVLERSKNKYIKACKEVERLVQNFQAGSSVRVNLSKFSQRPDSQSPKHSAKSNASRGKLRAKLEAAAHVATQSEKLHKSVVDETRGVQLRHHEDKQRLAIRYQTLHRARAEKVKSCLSRLAQVHCEQTDYLGSLVAELRICATLVSDQTDVQALTEEHASTLKSELALAEFEPYSSEILENSQLFGNPRSQAA